MIKAALILAALGGVLFTANAQEKSDTASGVTDDLRVACERNGSMWQLALKNAQSGEADFFDQAPFDLRSECQEALDLHGGSAYDGIFVCVPNESQSGWLRSLLNLNDRSINVYQSKSFETFESCAQDARKNYLWGETIATCEVTPSGAGVVRYAADGRVIFSETLHYENIKECTTALKYTWRIGSTSTFMICAPKSPNDWKVFDAGPISERETLESRPYRSLESCWMDVYSITGENGNLIPANNLERAKFSAVLQQCGEIPERLKHVRIEFTSAWLSNWYRKDSEASREALCNHTLQGIGELLNNATIFTNLSRMFLRSTSLPLEIDLPGSEIRRGSTGNFTVPDQWGSSANVDEIIRTFSLLPALETAEGFWTGTSKSKVRDASYCANLPGYWYTPTVGQLVAAARRGDFENAPEELGITDAGYFGVNHQDDFGVVSLIGPYAGSFARISSGRILPYQAEEFRICISHGRVPPPTR